MGWKRTLRLLVLGFVGFVILIQFVPYGHDHSNPPVTAEPQWDSPRTRELAARSCFDCHSNLTTWRWYSNVAPVSWLVQHDVDEGRAVLNFTEWDKPQDGLGDLAEVVAGGEMPPIQYALFRPGSKLSDAERQELVAGLRATIAASSSPAGG